MPPSTPFLHLSTNSAHKSARTPLRPLTPNSARPGSACSSPDAHLSPLGHAAHASISGRGDKSKQLRRSRSQISLKTTPAARRTGSIGLRTPVSAVLPRRVQLQFAAEEGTPTRKQIDSNPLESAVGGAASSVFVKACQASSPLSLGSSLNSAEVPTPDSAFPMQDGFAELLTLADAVNNAAAHILTLEKTLAARDREIAEIKAVRRQLRDRIGHEVAEVARLRQENARLGGRKGAPKLNPGRHVSLQNFASYFSPVAGFLATDPRAERRTSVRAGSRAPSPASELAAFTFNPLVGGGLNSIDAVVASSPSSLSNGRTRQVRRASLSASVSSAASARRACHACSPSKSDSAAAPDLEKAPTSASAPRPVRRSASQRSLSRHYVKIEGPVERIESTMDKSPSRPGSGWLEAPGRSPRRHRTLSVGA